jgi:hypothetical protein
MSQQSGREHDARHRLDETHDRTEFVADVLARLLARQSEGLAGCRHQVCPKIEFVEFSTIATGSIIGVSRILTGGTATCHAVWRSRQARPPGSNRGLDWLDHREEGSKKAAEGGAPCGFSLPDQDSNLEPAG